MKELLSLGCWLDDRGDWQKPQAVKRRGVADATDGIAVIAVDTCATRPKMPTKPPQKPTKLAKHKHKKKTKPVRKRRQSKGVAAPQTAAVIAEGKSRPPQTPLIIVDFMADWCGPCKAMKPILAQVAQERGVKVVPINVDTHSAVADRYKVQALPTLILVRELDADQLPAGPAVGDPMVGGCAGETVLRWFDAAGKL